MIFFKFMTLFPCSYRWWRRWNSVPATYLNLWTWVSGLWRTRKTTWLYVWAAVARKRDDVVQW